jgi:hypothetical protein
MPRMGIVQVANLNKKNANPIGVFFSMKLAFMESQLFRKLFILNKTALAGILNQLTPAAQAKLGH